MSKENLKAVENYFGKSFDEIFNDNIKYVNMTMKRLYYGYKDSIWYEDIRQCALIGLANAIETLDLNKIESLKAHIITSIRREVLYFEKSIFGSKDSAKRNAKFNSLDCETKESKNNRDSFIDGVFQEVNLGGLLYERNEDIYAPEENIVQKMDLKKAMAKLNDTERKIVLGVLSDKAQKTLAKELGISEAYVSKKMKQICAKMKSELEVVSR